MESLITLAMQYEKLYLLCCDIYHICFPLDLYTGTSTKPELELKEKLTVIFPVL